MLYRKHESLTLLTRNAKSNHTAMVERRYCPFVEQKIGEIGFVAIFQVNMCVDIARYRLPSLYCSWRVAATACGISVSGQSSELGSNLAH